MVPVVISTTSAFGQLSMGAAPVEDIKVSIDENGTAHVVHVVAGNATNAVHVEAISGNLTNFSVTDEDGKPIQYSTIGQKPISILLLPTQRNFTLVKYELPGIVSNDNGVWRWDYYAPSDAVFTDFHFPPGVDTIWILSNDKTAARPVYLAGKDLRQVGNGMHLAYMINESETVQTVQYNGQTFNVGIRTLSDVGPPAFDQSAKGYAFNVDKAHSFVTVIMPKSLLWGPYQGRMNENKTLTTEFHDNDTHSWIGFMPDTTRTLQITGTTAIPEFPMFVPLVVAISAVVALRFTSKLTFK